MAVDSGGGAWSPYLVGALIGVLSMVTFYFSDKPLGASSAYTRIAGLLTRLVAPGHAKSLPLYRETEPKVEWEVMLVVGVAIGAFIAAWSGGEFTGAWVPAAWAERFGDGAGLRQAAAFAGGAVMAFGARLAGGCTSGHGISGTMQLSVGSWVALACFFIGGAIVARGIYGS